jgi:cytolysin-activating lysine-acyltransferase
VARRACDNTEKLMTPVLLQQFRLFYDNQKPVGPVAHATTRRVLWARVSAEVEAMLTAGTTKLRPQDWRSGDRLWVVEVIAPFGRAGGAQGSYAEEMVRDLKAKVFPDRELKYVALGAGGKMEVRVV